MSTNPGASPANAGPGSTGATTAGDTAGLPGQDPCYGDEQITFSPENPRAGNDVLIAVSSHGPHPYGRLAGTERVTFNRQRPGQLGYVWEWTLTPTWPGEHEYTFYVDSTVPCAKVSFRVERTLATRVPTPYGQR